MHRLISWLSTLVFLPVFGTVMIVFDVAQRLAYAISPRAQEYVAGAVQWLLMPVFGLTGARLQVERHPGFKPWTDYIVISNHQSLFDIAILGGLLFSNFPKYISKRSLGRGVPTVSYNLRVGGHALIDRDDPAGAVAAIRALGRRVRRGGCSAVIFPEGTRARHGELSKFKSSGTLALLEEAPNTPVVPIAIDQSWRLLEHNFLPVPWGVHVRVWIGEPIPRRPDEEHAQLIERARAEIARRLGQWRGEPALSESSDPSRPTSARVQDSHPQSEYF